MEIYPVFSNWKNQYCQNDHTTHMQSTDSVKSLSNYQWHFFYRTRTNNLKIFIETQKTPNSQKNLEKKRELEESHTLISNYSKVTVI